MNNTALSATHMDNNSKSCIGGVGMIKITLATIMERVLNEEAFDLTDGILHNEEGVDLLPANIELSGVETSLVGIMSSETGATFDSHLCRA